MTSKRKLRNLTDLAKQVNVTATTVSLALRNSPRLSAELREKIQQMAAEYDFTPRAYNRRPDSKAEKKNTLPEPVLLLGDDHGHEDPVRDGIMPVVSQKLSRNGIEFQYVHMSELRNDSASITRFTGAIFCNDLIDVRLPEDFPAVQVFGWEARGNATDRITTNDEEVVEIVVDYFRKAKVKRAAIFWDRHMVTIPNHPRITGFLARMADVGIEAESLSFTPEEPDFFGRVRAYIEKGDDRIGFFGFNALSGVRLCCALESLGVMKKYGEENVLICDKSLLLNSFFPRPAMIDLNLPSMAERATEMLLWRFANPGAPRMLALQSPSLWTR